MNINSIEEIIQNTPIMSHFYANHLVLHVLSYFQLGIDLVIPTNAFLYTVFEKYPAFYDICWSRTVDLVAHTVATTAVFAGT